MHAPAAHTHPSTALSLSQSHKTIQFEIPLFFSTLQFEFLCMHRLLTPIPVKMLYALAAHTIVPYLHILILYIDSNEPPAFVEVARVSRGQSF